MCLTIYKDQKPKIATEDIYTLKYLDVIRGKLYSPIKEHKWILRRKQEHVYLHAQPDNLDLYRIHNGYYSFNIDKLESYQIMNRNFFLSKIPKGTLYYEDAIDAQVVSENLVIMELVYSHDGTDKKLCKDHEIVTRMSYPQRWKHINKMLKSYNLNTEL